MTRMGPRQVLAAVAMARLWAALWRPFQLARRPGSGWGGRVINDMRGFGKSGHSNEWGGEGIAGPPASAGTRARKLQACAGKKIMPGLGGLLAFRPLLQRTKSQQPLIRTDSNPSKPEDSIL